MTDLSKLSTINENDVHSLCKGVVNLLANASDSELLSVLNDMKGDSKINQELARSLILFYQKSLEEKSSKDIMVRVLTTTMNVNNKLANIIVECYYNSNQYELLSNSLINKTICINSLIDLDWSFGVTAASSDLDQVGKTFLQMRLTIKTNNDNDTTTTTTTDDENNESSNNSNNSNSSNRDIFLELSLEQFYHFLAQLESAKAYLDLMSET